MLSGVANILNGYGPVAGAAIARHSDIDKIAFTGSTNTARQIVKLAATNLKKVTIEAGGKSPLVVFEDAKLEQAVKWAHSGIMSNMGQICSATSRILVQEAIYEDFLALFCKHISDVSKVGDPFETDTSQGPQVTKAQFDRILQYIESGKSEGAKLVMGGKPHKSTPEGKGFYVAPTVFRDVKQDMKIFKEEIFGPVVVLTPFETETDAINIANDSIYGLGASVFTRDISKAHRVARRIESGVIWINSSNDYAVSVPFGGFKQSGIGSEMGEAGLEEYTNTKSVYVNLGDEL